MVENLRIVVKNDAGLTIMEPTEQANTVGTLLINPHRIGNICNALKNFLTSFFSAEYKMKALGCILEAFLSWCSYQRRTPEHQKNISDNYFIPPIFLFFLKISL